MSTDAPKRVALYARVSTKQHGQDPETQLLPLRDYTNRRGFHVFCEYIDVGYSGAKQRRPQLDRMMHDAKLHKFDAVIVARFDRFARSVSHLLRALEEFHQLGIDFISLNEAVDTSTPVGKLVFTILGAVGEMERAIIQERVKAGVDRAKKDGKRLGRPRPLVDEEKLCEQLAEGQSPQAVARHWGIARGTVVNIARRRGVQIGPFHPVKSGARVES